MTGYVSHTLGAGFPTLGLVLPKGPGPVGDWPDAGRWFRTLEQDGCGAIWFTDHLFFPHPTPEALTMAAVAAANTSSCLIGTAVLQLPLRQIASVAKASATIAALAPDRFILGLGVGEHREEYALTGAPFGGRGRALDAGIEQLRNLWSPTDEWFVQKPAPGSLSLWLGGRSEQSITRAASIGDGWIPMFVSPEGFQRRSTLLDQLLADALRSPDAVRRAMVVLISVDETAWGGAEARSWTESLFRAPSGAFDRHVVTGSASRCAAVVQEYLDAGAEHVAILATSPNPARCYHAVSEALGAGR